jgi:myb proto-oncogene protein
MRTVLAEPAEDAPYTRWYELIKHLPGKTGSQARGRWSNTLNPAIDRTPFGREDDLALLKGHSEFGKRWVEISELVFQSRRSENQVKYRVRDGICLFTF